MKKKQALSEGSDADELSSSGPLSSRLPFVLNILSLLCAIWFCIYGVVWVYLIALVMAYPVGLLGWVLHLYARKVGGVSRLNRAVRSLYLVGLVLSGGSLLFTL